MNEKSIPGFYFDQEKQKYFRIQGPGAAQGANFKYTAENIRKEERDEHFKEIAAIHSERSRKSRVVNRYTNHISQVLMDKEIGAKRKLFYMYKSWPDACAFGLRSDHHQHDHVPRKKSIRHFDQNPVSQTIFAVQGENRVVCRRKRSKKEQRVPPQHTNNNSSLIPETCWEPWQELIRTTSTVSSLCRLPISGGLAVTTFGSDRPPVVYLSDPEGDESHVGQSFTPRWCTTIWAAAAKPADFLPSQGVDESVPAAQTEQLAVGASRSLLLFTRLATGSWNCTRAIPSFDSDVLALDWIADTTIVAGCRDGRIHLYDTRSGGSSYILRHPYPIAQIKRADDETRLICSGLQNSLFLYDMRSSRSLRSSPAQSPPNHQFHSTGSGLDAPCLDSHVNKRQRRLHQAAWSHWSQPVLSFLHQNSEDLELGFDYHRRFGLIAAAQEPASGTAIRISNSWTGRTVKEIKLDENLPSHREDSEKIRCVKFMNAENSDSNIALWTCWNRDITEIAW